MRQLLNELDVSVEPRPTQQRIALRGQSVVFGVALMLRESMGFGNLWDEPSFSTSADRSERWHSERRLGNAG